MFNNYPEYINKELKKELDEKWFSVYNYINLKELILTSRKDFLEILVKINSVFAIVSIILWVINIFILLAFLLIWYSIIFLIIFIKLLKRTYLFLHISDVIYTKKWLLLSDNIYYYKEDNEKLRKKLDFYSMEFQEYLWKPSNLTEIISKKKAELSDSTLKHSKKLSKIMSNVWSSKESMWLILALWIAGALYVGFLYLFYYIWYFISYIFSFIYIIILKIIIFFKDKVELKIKNITLNIDSDIQKMHHIYDLLKSKLDRFKSWEISDISSFTEDKFKNFYNQISLILNEKEKLEIIINKSKYKDFIDLFIFKKYLKNNFNKPIIDMVSLLSKYEKLIIEQIEEIKSSKINKNELSAHLSQKKFMLDDKLKIIKFNISKLNKSIL